MKLILLIGFSKGLGKAIFDQLITKLKPDQVELLAVGRNITGLPPYNGVIYHQADLSKDNCWGSIKEQLPNTISSLDIIVNASVIEPIGTVGTLTDYQLKHAVLVNYISPMKLINKLISNTEQSTYTTNIFNISSGASSRPIHGWALYCSTKAAFKMFLDVTELESENSVSVKHIDPGIIDTDMQQTIREKSSKEMKNVKQFKEFKQANVLQSPTIAARKVLDNIGYI